MPLSFSAVVPCSCICTPLPPMMIFLRTVPGGAGGAGISITVVSGCDALPAKEARPGRIDAVSRRAKRPVRPRRPPARGLQGTVSYTHLRAHETPEHLV